MKTLTWLTVSLIILSACNPLDHGGVPPIASYKITPESGKTTDTVRFDASLTQPGSLSNKVYYRWDWNHDGIWDEADKLLPGESTDFNALYAGYREETTAGVKFKWINYATYFWSFNKMSNPYAPNSWNLALIKGEKKFYPGFSDMKSYYSVRCVKNSD